MVLLARLHLFCNPVCAPSFRTWRTLFLEAGPRRRARVPPPVLKLAAEREGTKPGPGIGLALSVARREANIRVIPHAGQNGSDCRAACEWIARGWPGGSFP